MARLRGRPPALWLGLAAALTILILLLTSAPPGVTLRADARPFGPVAVKAPESCYGLQVLPDDTRYVRLNAPVGQPVPRQVRIEVAGMAPITAGGPVRRGADRTAVEYRLPQPTRGDRVGVQICLSAPPGGLKLTGEAKRPMITLLGAPHANWLAALPQLAERAAFGRGTVLGAAALPLALVMLAAAWWLALREISGAGREAAPVGRRTLVRVGVVGALFAGAFALVTPPFEAPDEMVHLGYVELLADQHALPRTTKQLGDMTSKQGQEALGSTQVTQVAFNPGRRPPWSQLEDRAMDERLAKLPTGDAIDSFTNASSQPPAYYTVLAVGTSVTGGSVLDRLLVARLLSALLMGLAAAGAVAFAREAVPRAGGLAIAGGVMVATLPVVAFIGGSVNPDALLAPVAAWMLAVLARILRRGPTVRSGVALGALAGLGVVTKLIFAALLPAVALAALVVLVRAVRAREVRPALLSIVAAVGAMLVVAAPYLGWAVLSGRGIAFGPPGGTASVFTFRENVVYMVELFVGQFGPIADRIQGSGPWDIWLSGLVGRLGWLDYGFPAGWVHLIAAGWGVLALLAAWGVVRAARARRAVPMDAVVYVVAVLGLALMISRAGLNARLAGNVGFEQARYLLPVAAIGAGGVALALRQLPRPALRNWAAALVVTLALSHGTAALFLTVGRYFA